MRKETKAIATAFIARKPASMARTKTDGETIWLHGNRIAWRTADGSIYATLAGWNTPTTRDRINGLSFLLGGPSIYTRKGEPFCGDEPIDDRQNILIRPSR